MENKAPQLRAIFFYATLLFGFLTMSYVNFQLSNFFNADIEGSFCGCASVYFYCRSFPC